jgi:hypothetical protein
MHRIKCLFAVAFLIAALSSAPAQCTESFDKDPGWDGHNNRIARELPPRTARQDFGYSAGTQHAGGQRGEIGGTIQPAAEPAYYARRIQVKTLNNHLSASGKLLASKGESNSLFGFFNDKSLNEWRTPNAIVVRIQARGEFYYAHVEFTTRKWRAAASMIGVYDPVADRNHEREIPCDVAYEWSLEYDPTGNNENGKIVFTLAGEKAVINVTPDFRLDGASFNRFGLLNVIKSYDDAGDLWLDDVTIDGETQDFSHNPKWTGLRNRSSYETKGVRPWFDFGFSPTNYARGAAQGEIGGMIYRGDCRYPERLGSYGARLKTLTLDRPLRASGKVAMRRGVTDSTTAIGFYNSVHSVAVNDSQKFTVPRDFLGIYIEGPSRDGFFFYPVCRNQLEDVASRYPDNSPQIMPDGTSHDWTLVYDPTAAQGNGRITVTLDGKSVGIDLTPGLKANGAVFDRFGIVTPWIDGNGQEVYFDDLEYTSR